LVIFCSGKKERRQKKERKMGIGGGERERQAITCRREAKMEAHKL